MKANTWHKLADLMPQEMNVLRSLARNSVSEARSLLSTYFCRMGKPAKSLEEAIYELALHQLKNKLSKPV